MSTIKQILCFLAVPFFNIFVEGYFKVRTLFYREPQRTEKTLVVVIPSYNNACYYKRNLDSVLNQRYQNFRVIYIDDNSPDSTGLLVKDHLKQHPQGYRVELIQNSDRKGALANLYYAIHSCDDNEVIVTIDGDDWFAHKDVLARINREYQENDAWLTYGSYITFPWARRGICASIDQMVYEMHSYRKTAWVTSHTRTFYAWLFKLIKKKDLQEDGAFLSVAWDMAFMFPMIEMAGRNHIRFIPDITYIYNVETPLNDYKVRVQEQHRVEGFLRSKEPYLMLNKEKERQ